MASTSTIYRAAARAAVPLVPVVLRSVRDRAAHAARITAPAAMADWARAARDPARPLAWFHAPSVGEGLQARAVMEAWHERHPEFQLAYTHFSPSATGLARSINADYTGYLPYDRRGDIDAALGALRPDLLVFTKLDLWPELATRARTHGTRVAMVAATVLPDSSRLGRISRQLTAPGYAALNAVGAVSDADVARLVRLGTVASRITVTGDPRIDSVLGVAGGRGRVDPVQSLIDPARTLVAGSTWQADETVLVGAFAMVRNAHPDARLVIVPHEPDAVHLARLEAALSLASLSHVRIDAIGSQPDAAVIVVDRLGLLARLYAAGELAYVGGGFGSAGLHSVLEPVARGRMVWIGPRDRGSSDAALLRVAGALSQLSADRAGEQLAGEWSAALHDDADRRRRGTAARSALEPERGAAARSANLLDQLMTLSLADAP